MNKKEEFHTQEENYRESIYQNYSAIFAQKSNRFDSNEADKWAKPYLHRFRNWFPKSKNAAIVDIACGNGELLHFFKTRGFQNLQGTDISLGQYQIAKQVLDTIENQDALTYLKNRKAEFELITGLDIIEHLTKNEVLEFLSHCYNSLKPGGRLILQTPNGACPWVSEVRYGDFSHEICLTPKLTGQLLKLTGFQQIEIRECGPVPWGYSLGCSLRYLVWSLIKLIWRFCHFVETGERRKDVMTRVFIVSCLKPEIPLK